MFEEDENPLNEFKVLVLDRSYQVIGVVSWQRAMLLYFGNKAEVLEYYEDFIINSCRDSWNCPSVLKVNYTFKKHRIISFNRKSILTRDNFTCAYCDNHFIEKELTLDHIIPLSQGGSNSWENIISACNKCNQRKANRTPNQAGMELNFKPFTPKWNPLFLLKSYGCKIRDNWKPYLPEMD